MRRHVEIFLKFTRASGHPHPYLQAAIRNYALLLSKMGLQEPEVRQLLIDLLAKYGLSLE